ncbi:MAG: amino acid adenylation domain-containing protein, partial [Acidobacteriota bacterium]|nr:amino acid adenylation domain-containing protein [Acidobacteriota bacterium]
MAKKKIEDAYPLSPIQQGMLFHDIQQPGAYFVQVTCTLLGALDASAFEAAWQGVADRHPVLRSAFAWKNTPTPLQVVGRRVAVPFRLEDWSDLDAETRELRWHFLLEEDRRQGVDLSRPPLMRLTLVRVAEEEYRFLWSLHHLLLDGWSYPLVLEEVIALYETAVAGAPEPELPQPQLPQPQLPQPQLPQPQLPQPQLPERRPFRDYIAWLRRQDLDRAKEYWRRRLQGIEEPTPLGIDGVAEAPAEDDEPYAEVHLDLGTELSSRINALAASHNLTAAAVVEGVWGLLLARYSGRREVVFGSIGSGRPAALPGVEGMIGMFVSTLPVRVAVEPDTPLVTWLQKLQGEQLDARQYEYTPLVEIQRWSDVTAGQPLFETCLSFQNYPLDEALAEHTGSLGFQGFQIHEDPGFPIMVVAIPGPAMALKVEHDLRRVSADAARRLLRHLEHLLQQAVVDPHRPVREWSHLTDGERHQLEVEWNASVTEYPRDLNLHQLVERQVRSTPQATAAVDGADELTYAELNRRANRLAHALRRAGVGPEVVVGLCVERSPDLLVGMLGILKAGGAYLPLDSEHPDDRLAGLVQASGAALLVARDEVLERLPALAAAQLPQISPQVAEESGAELSEEDPEPLAGPDNLAYAIYTSGSTGAPKGVLIPHRAVVNYSLDMVHRFRLEPEDRVLQFASLGFNVVVEEVFPTLLAGAAVVLHREDLLLSLQELERVVADNRITGLELPAAFWHQWVHDLEARGETPPESLRFLLLGCERPKAERLAAWQRWGIDLLYVFGLTETTVTSSLHRLSSADAPAYELPIGRPVANTRLYVLDSDLQPVAARVVGQLYIAGDGVGRGYLGRPDLTAERFVPDPFAAEPGARMYRTGDRARYRAGGELDFLGRADFQLKIRGYRVEPGEVEAALEEHPAVRSSVVVARPGPAGDARLVAFLTLSDEGEEDADAGFPSLRQDLAGQLPDYMVPSRFVALKALPLSPNGKVDRRALPEVDVVPQLVAGERVAPRSELEGQLAEIWRQVLGLEEVGVHDDFFELGGDSILSIQITARANREGLGITARQLFEHPTIAGLAAVAGGEGARAEQGPVTGATPLTPIQRWFLDGERNGYDHFTLPVAVELAEALSPAVLDGALERLLEHHDALRGRYLRSAEGRWQMELAAPGQVPSPGPVVVDLTALSEADQAAALERQGQGLQAGLDIAAGRLLSAVLFRRSAGDPMAGELLVLACHHLAVDAVSWRILLEDLVEAGGKLAAGEEPALPPKTTSWQTWAEVLAEGAASPALALEADYWLAPERAAVQTLPVDHDDAEDLEGDAETVTVRLDAETTTALLQEVPKPYRTRINDALLSALGAVLARWTGEELQLVELEAHGREEQMGEGLDLSRTVGWFTALVPVLLDLRGAEGPGQRLMAVKEQLRSIPGAGLGHGLLSSLPPAAENEGSDLARSLAELPHPEVLFNYVGRVAAGTGEGGEPPLRLVETPIGAPVAPGERRSHRLVINAGVRDDELEVAWTFGSQVYDRGTVEGLAQQLLDALAELVDHCKSPEAGAWTPSDFPLAKAPISRGGADLTQPQLEALLAEGAGDEEGFEVEDLYPLSPLQKGMLFHALYSPQAGLYMAQVLCRLQGDLDLDAFLGAWQDVMERRAVLRTSFRWDGLEAALQLVQRRAELPAAIEDWREESAPAVEQKVQEYLQEDRQSSFELDRAPLQRLLLARLDDDRWQLVWSFHQSIFDGWSLPLLFQDLFASYGARVTGETVELPAAKPYRDYIAWLQQQDPAAARDYWTRQLADFTDPTPLPEDRPAPPGPPVHGEQTAELSAEATAALGALARRSQLTINTLVQGAWALLLSLYSREDDVVFGGTVAGRPADLPGVEAIVGLFINTLPVRVEVAPNRPVLGWLREIQERQAEQRQFQHTALADIQRWSQLAAGESLFDSFLVFQNYPVAKALEASPLIKVEDYRTEERPHYGLTLVVHPLDQLRLELAYDARRLEAVSVRRLLGLLDRWLTAMAEDPWARLRDLSPLSEVEAQQLLVEWNDTAMGRPVTQPVHRLFEQQAAQRPAALALELGNQRLSYADLDRAANRLARHLRSLGVAPGVTVGLCVRRSLDMVVGTLAIWKAGGVFVPLDPSYPEDRLNFIVEDSAPPVVLAGPNRARALPEGVVRVDLEADAAQWRDLPSEDLPSEDWPDSPGLEDLAYLIYTSGTTGRPKAVEVEHGNLAHTLTQVGREFGFHAGDAMLYMASFAFDISLFECFAPLLNGGTVLIQTRQDVLDLAQLEQRLERATLIHAVPTLMRQLVDDLRAAGGFERRTAGVRRIFLGGDRVPAELIRDTQEVFPAARVVILYGPTEATIVCASYAVPRPYLGDQALIGRPLPGVGLRLVGAFGVPVPVGVPGEVWISGPGVTRGYRNRTQLTEEKFVEVDGVRWYRTGDLARWLPSGVLEFRGRIDQQVKIRGFRIEVGEIEAVLGGHPQVGVAVVMAREDSPGDRRLVAYTVAERGEEAPSTAELRAYAEERLPDYMVPALFIPLEELPLSPTGKVDRRALPAPEIARGDLGVDYVAPRNRRETLLAEIFAAVLKTQRVGVHDSFFDLGGDSILSIQIVSRAKAQGVTLSPRQIFEHPTVAELAGLDAPSPSLGPDQGLVTGTMAPVPVQRELLEGEHPPEALVVGRWLRLEAPVDTQALTSAVARLQLHHDALRLRRNPEGELVFGGEDVVTPLEVLDLGDFSDAERSEREGEVAEDARSRVAAAWPYGFRALLFLDGSGGGRLLLLAHRLGMDVTSWRFLIADLDTLYRHYRDTTAVQLPAKSGSFKQWSEVLMARGGSDELRQEAPWWRARADVVPLFPQRPVTGAVRRAGAQSLSRELTERLLGPALEPYRLQPVELLVAALAAALAEHGEERRLRLGLDVDGRKALSLETDFTRSVGHFDIFFPLTLEVPPEDASGQSPVEALGELLKEAKEAHRGAPRDGLFYGLLRHHGLEDAAGTPPQVCLQWKVLDPLVSSAALSFDQALDSDPPLDRGVGLLVEAATVDGVLEVHWIVREGFLEAAELEALESSFEGHLERIVEHCLDPAAGAFTPSDFPWAQVTQEELDRLAPGGAGVDDIYALSPLQQGMLFHEVDEPGAYLVQITCTLHGALDVDAFRRSWADVVAGIPMLRTSFRWRDTAEPLQVVHSAAELPVAVEDWTELDRDEQDRRLEELRREDRRRPVELDAAPLMRLTLVRRGDDEIFFLWTLSHIILDGWSYPLVLQDVLQRYQALVDDSPLVEIHHPLFRDYIRWLAQQDLDEAEGFWRRLLSDVTGPTPLGVDRRRGDATGSHEERRLLSTADTESLSAVAVRHRLTVNTLVEGAWALLLARYSGEDSVVFGAIGSGRPADLAGVEGMIGLFLNTLPVRAWLEEDEELVPWLRRLQGQRLTARQYEYTPLAKIQQWSGIGGGQPLFESSVSFQNYPLDESLADGAEGLSVSGFHIGEEASFPLLLGSMPGPQLPLIVEYQRSRFDDATIHRLLGHLETLLLEMAREPERRLSELSLLTAAERRQLLEEWSGELGSYPDQDTVHSLVFGAGEKDPQAPAVLCGEVTLSHGELAAASAALARKIVAAGATPGTLVGLCVQRSERLVVGLMGILQAGCAYVPLDPAYPADRLAY